MLNEAIHVMREDWNILIILDACRYDYFEHQWKDYFSEGRLFQKRSVGSCTDEWRKKSFPDVYNDVVYISANPHFSSEQSVRGYCAGDHFLKVYEIWKEGWDSSVGTVLPSTLTDAALDILRLSCTKGKRVIIHYLQPHAPYLSLKAGSKGHTIADINQRKGFVGEYSDDSSQTLRKWLYNQSYRLLKNTSRWGNHPDWALRRLFSLPARTPMEYTLQQFSVKELRKAYEENLKHVLSETVRLLRYLSGTIVITSDHGEFLGENKNFSHPYASEDPIVRNIPWLVIEREEAELDLGHRDANHSQPDDDSEALSEEAVIERLRLLGYHD